MKNIERIRVASVGLLICASAAAPAQVAVASAATSRAAAPAASAAEGASGGKGVTVAIGVSVPASVALIAPAISVHGSLGDAARGQRTYDSVDSMAGVPVMNAPMISSGVVRDPVMSATMTGGLGQRGKASNKRSVVDTDITTLSAVADGSVSANTAASVPSADSAMTAVSPNMPGGTGVPISDVVASGENSLGGQSINAPALGAPSPILATSLTDTREASTATQSITDRTIRSIAVLHLSSPISPIYGVRRIATVSLTEKRLAPEQLSTVDTLKTITNIAAISKPDDPSMDSSYSGAGFRSSGLNGLATKH